VYTVTLSHRDILDVVTLSDTATTVTIDTVAPSVNAVSPMFGATDVSTTGNISITFNESVGWFTDDVVIHNALDDSVFETISVAGGPVGGSGTNTLFINPRNNFDELTEYYVLVDEAAIRDLTGNTYAGINDETYWTFTTGVQPTTKTTSRSGSSRRSSSSRSTTPVETTTTPTNQVTSETTNTNTTATFTFTRNLEVGSVGSDVQELQTFLNTNGFVIAATGAGSPGNETTTFGSLTQAALARFQQANGIAPASGYFGPITRAFIATMNGVSLVLPTTTIETPITPTITAIVRDLDMNMQGDDVTALQTLLIAQGFAIPAGTTGFFGTQTQQALAAYQQANNIAPASGYFGSVTRAQMKSAGVSGLWW